MRPLGCDGTIFVLGVDLGRIKDEKAFRDNDVTVSDERWVSQDNQHSGGVEGFGGLLGAGVLEGNGAWAGVWSCLRVKPQGLGGAGCFGEFLALAGGSKARVGRSWVADGSLKGEVIVTRQWTIGGSRSWNWGGVLARFDGLWNTCVQRLNSAQGPTSGFWVVKLGSEGRLSLLSA